MLNSEISTYTISVYELIENGFDFQLNEYPIFDENYRNTLNNAILNFYMFREIGFVNPIVWRHRLKTRLDIIMRNQYNDIYKAKAKEFNPLYTMELYEEYTHKVDNNGMNTSNGEVNSNSNSTNTQSNNATSSGNSSRNNSNLGLSSQFPSEEMTENDLTSNLFVDSANKASGNEVTTGTSTQNENANIINSGTDKMVNTTSGTTTNNTTETFSKSTIGSASDLSFAHAMVQFKEYCDQFRLDEQIIDELKDLFIQIW